MRTRTQPPCCPRSQASCLSACCHGGMAGQARPGPLLPSPMSVPSIAALPQTAVSALPSPVSLAVVLSPLLCPLRRRSRFWMNRLAIIDRRFRLHAANRWPPHVRTPKRWHTSAPAGGCCTLAEAFLPVRAHRLCTCPIPRPLCMVLLARCTESLSSSLLCARGARRLDTAGQQTGPRTCGSPFCGTRNGAPRAGYRAEAFLGLWCPGFSGLLPTAGSGYPVFSLSISRGTEAFLARYRAVDAWFPAAD